MTQPVLSSNLIQEMAPDFEWRGRSFFWNHTNRQYQESIIGANVRDRQFDVMIVYPLGPKWVASILSRDEGLNTQTRMKTSPPVADSPQEALEMAAQRIAEAVTIEAKRTLDELGAPQVSPEPSETETIEWRGGTLKAASIPKSYTAKLVNETEVTVYHQDFTGSWVASIHGQQLVAVSDESKESPQVALDKALAQVRVAYQSIQNYAVALNINLEP